MVKENHQTEIDIKINSLIDKMTLAEKVGQLNQLGASIYGKVSEEGFEDMIRKGQVGTFLTSKGVKTLNRYQRIAMEESRLKIPLIFAADVIHGIRTIFPTPLAESCSWNPDIAYQTAQMASFEATALGLKWTYAPMVDIARDCRWGRIMEGAGEDTYLGTLFAKARVDGFQGKNSEIIDQYHMAACAKHFAGYGAAEAGKDYNSTQISEYNMNNVYLPPFKACVESGVLSFMTAFNEINGTPCSVSQKLNYEILRKQWGFKGILVTDWQALPQVLNHGYSSDEEDCTIDALNSRVSADMAGEFYFKHIEGLVNSGRISEKIIDELVRHILYVKFKLGLFDNPYADETREAKDLKTEKAFKIALKSAEQSIVLLKNDKTLPLKDKTKILLVGHLANNKVEMHGNWAMREHHESTVSILEGLEECFDVQYIKGYELDEIEPDFFDAVKDASKNADVIIATIGESLFESGEARCKTDITLRSCHKQVIDILSNLGKPLVGLLINGRPLAIEDEVKKCNAFVECWQLGTMAGKAIANVLSGRFNPQGRLTVSFPRKTGQCPIYYNTFTTGRPYNPKDFYTSRYLDCDEGATFAFGYGLSYSEFELSNYTLSKERAKIGENVSLSVDVSNKSDILGSETIQLYFKDISSKPVRPNKELLRFVRMEMCGNVTKKAVLTFNTRDLGMAYDSSLRKKVEKGKFKLYLGINSEDYKEFNFEVI